MFLLGRWDGGQRRRWRCSQWQVPAWACEGPGWWWHLVWGFLWAGHAAWILQTHKQLWGPGVLWVLPQRNNAGWVVRSQINFNIAVKQKTLCCELNMYFAILSTSCLIKFLIWSRTTGNGRANFNFTSNLCWAVNMSKYFLLRRVLEEFAGGRLPNIKILDLLRSTKCLPLPRLQVQWLNFLFK